MTGLRPLVETAIDAVTIRSASSFSWFGQRSLLLRPKVERALTPEIKREFLLYSLQLQLYSGFYCRGSAVVRLPETAVASGEIGKARHVEELSLANGGEGFWEEGWQAVEVEQRSVSVHRNGVTLRAGPNECQPMRGGRIAAGDSVRVHFSKELRESSAGFYFALGNRELRSEAGELVRLYWNATSNGAVDLVQLLTASLNRGGIAFRLKAANQPELFRRCDNVVLYIYKADYASAQPLLEAAYREVFLELRQGTPVFTKPLAAGLGLAEDPSGSESFGLHRCRLMADGLVRAFEQGHRGLAARYRAIGDRFSEEGLTLEMPYLNPGSSDLYMFSLPTARLPETVSGPRTAAQPDDYLSAAEAIGRRIVTEARWHEDRCNWLGSTAQETGDSEMPAVVSFGALGPELYDGTSGVALFLAELSRATGNAQERRAALGAIRHALSKADAVPPLKRFGLYTGWPGIALAAGRLAQLFGEQELLESAMGLLRRCDAEDVGEDQFDLLSGLAGAVVAALALHPLLEARSVLESAQRWGEQLLKTAVRFRDTCSWGFARERQRRRLTGISHGTTGVASALLELYMATGDEQFRAAAEGAFRYERRWFDDRSGNWPDFRGDTRPATVRSGGISYATFWCHGAPGISLSRLRAAEVLADPELRREADVGAETTLRETELWVNSGMANYSLCHGLAGNAEVLVTAAEKLGGPQEPALGLALEVAALGIAKHLKAGKPWPCGVSGGENHSLMLGLAGIGHFYLRLKDRAVPSVLLLHSQSFSARKAQQA